MKNKIFKSLLFLLFIILITSCSGKKPYIPVYTDVENKQNKDFRNNVQTNLNQISKKFTEEENLLVLDYLNQLELVLDFKNTYINRMQSYKDKNAQDLTIKNYLDELDYSIISFLNENNVIEAKHIIFNAKAELKKLVNLN